VDAFTSESTLLQTIGDRLGIFRGQAMVGNRPSSSTEAALRERVKELSCLYGIAQIAARPDISMDEILRGIVKLLPPAWQYPETTVARITLDGRVHSTPAFRESHQKQTTDIVVGGNPRGTVEVAYVEGRPECDEGPFLEEERNLIDGVARQVGLILEHKQTEEEASKLYDQLMHADRLATIGLLAAGVAHELNEPLANILGFSQLVKKCPGTPQQALKDTEKIESASLRAREIIKKLLTFARQVPPQKKLVNLNQVVDEGLFFFDARCQKNGIELVRSLALDLPEITADPAQLNQVLVNLAANALHEMAQGGTLRVETHANQSHVLLIIEDTGPGMSREIIKKIFTPFFTTKDVGKGTGLGLSVVHGIVTSHGGEIKVDSKVGVGTKFEIQLPIAREKETMED